MNFLTPKTQDFMCHTYILRKNVTRLNFGLLLTVNSRWRPCFVSQTYFKRATLRNSFSTLGGSFMPSFMLLSGCALNTQNWSLSDPTKRLYKEIEHSSSRAVALLDVFLCIQWLFVRLPVPKPPPVSLPPPPPPRSPRLSPPFFISVVDTRFVPFFHRIQHITRFLRFLYCGLLGYT